MCIIATLFMAGCDIGFGYDNSDDCGRITGRDLILSRISLDSLGTSTMESFARVQFEEDHDQRSHELIGVSEDGSTFYIIQGRNHNSPAQVYSLTPGEDSLHFLFELPDVTSLHYSPQYNRFIYWKDNINGVAIQRIDANGTNNIPIGNYRARIGELLSDEEHIILRDEIIKDSTGIWQLNIYSLSLTQLVDDVPPKFYYAINPDGSRIAYGRTYNARGEFDPTLYVRSTSDTTVTMYTGGGFRGLRFSHDGKWLTYLNASDRNNPQPYRVWFINLETSEQFAVGNPLRESFIGFNYPSFTINDKYVLFGFKHEAYYVPIDENASQELYFDRSDYYELRSSGKHSGSSYNVHTSTKQYTHNGSWLYRADDVTVRTSCH